LRCEGRSVDCLAFSPDGRTLALGCNPPVGQPNLPIEVKLWDLARGGKVGGRATALPGYKSRIERLVFSPDGAALAVASADGMVRLWRLSQKRLVASLAGHVGSVESVAFSPDG